MTDIAVNIRSLVILIDFQCIDSSCVQSAYSAEPLHFVECNSYRQPKRAWDLTVEWVLIEGIEQAVLCVCLVFLNHLGATGRGRAKDPQNQSGAKLRGSADPTRRAGPQASFVRPQASISFNIPPQMRPQGASGSNA